MLLNLKYLFIGLLASSGIASAAVVNEWTPTANDVNFFSFQPMNGWVPTETIGIFNATDDIATISPVAFFTNGATISFSQDTSTASYWDIKVSTINSSGVITTGPQILLASNEFQLAWNSNGTWIPLTGDQSSQWTPNLWQLTFINNKLSSNNLETIYATNLKPSIVANTLASVSSIPLPATAWSFMAGIFALLGFGKRKQIV